MYHPATRLLTILELLQSHAVLTGQDLARRIEVDVRTVRRYVTMLQDMGMPIEAERGRYGGYRLRPGFKLPPLMFNEEEALALTLGLLLIQRFGLNAAAPAVEGAVAKVERVMPDALRQQVQAIQSALVVDFPLPEVDPPASDVVMALCLAVDQHKRAHLHYRSWNGEESQREVDPYGVAYRAGYWYTAGYCHLRQDLRTFRLDRVLDARVGTQSFTRPADFNILTHVEHSIARTPGTWAVDVLLHTDLEAAEKLVSPSLAMLEEEADGVSMRCHIYSLDWFALVLVGIDCPLVIREPPELREAMKNLAAKAARMAQL